MKSLIVSVFVMSVGCAVGHLDDTYKGACEHWAACEGSSVSVDQCKQDEGQNYNADLAMGCANQADALEVCLTNMPCDGFVDTASEEKYCGKEMQALADCP